MIVKITRVLLLIQILAVFSLFSFAKNLWPPHHFFLLDILFGLAVVLAFRLAIVLNSFLMAAHFRSPLPNNQQLPLHKLFRLVHQEFQATMMSSSWSMPFQTFQKRSSATSAGLPVLLIHGYLCNSGYWHPMSQALAKASITHYALDLEPIFGSIDDHVDTVHRAIEALCRETHQEKIIIVAHSMGGLVTRAYLRDFGQQRTAKIITLGTPHHGSALACYGVGINANQMCLKNEMPSLWLQQLDESENKTTRALFVSIYSHHDNIVSPQISSHFQGAKNIDLHGIGHVALAFDQRVQEIVINEILQSTSMPMRATSH